MNEQLKGRIQNAWAMLDPVDPLRGLLSDLLDALAQPEQQPLGWIASMAHNDLRDGIFRDVTIYGAELDETIPIYTAPPLPVQERGDSVCKEDDGCPTERAVLQRFWRETQTDIREMREGALSQYVEGRSTEYWKGYGKACQDILNNIKEKNT